MKDGPPPNSSITFRPDDCVGPSMDVWQASNCALARLLAKHRGTLAAARSTAVQIRGSIDRLIESMETLRHRTCRFCPEPCCITNTVWFDFRDLLILHLLEAPLPIRQAATEPGENCPFLFPHGCRLPWQIRPWMCIKYLCPAQRAAMKNTGRPFQAALYDDIGNIETQRTQLELQVVRRIRRRRQTAASSTSAWPL